MWLQKFDAHVGANNFTDLQKFKLYSTRCLLHGSRVYFEKRRVATTNKMSIGVMKKDQPKCLFFVKKKRKC